MEIILYFAKVDEGIPAGWRQKLAMRKVIEKLADDIFALAGGE
jgi:hypothetical protein